MAREAIRRHDAGESWRGIARSFNVQATQLKGWCSDLPRLEASSNTNFTLHTGRQSILAPYEERIVGWILEQRDRGVPVSYTSVVRKFQASIPEFQGKNLRAKYMIVRRLCVANHITMRIGTKKAQDHPQLTLDKSLSFLRGVRPLLSTPYAQGSLILNMDQTAVWFSNAPRRTLNLQGERTVPIVSSDTSSCRATVAVTVSSACAMLKPLVVFKGQKNGQIAQRSCQCTGTGSLQPMFAKSVHGLMKKRCTSGLTSFWSHSPKKRPPEGT